MVQIFRPISNKLVYFGLVVFAMMLFTISIIAYAYFRSSYYYGVGVLREQPIPFSHKPHVQGLGLDCRFCHAAVEKSKTAGMPSTEVCMSCHSQILYKREPIIALRKSFVENRPIAWNRIHVLADYVFFNHSIHVKKGVSCQNCHGEVKEMNQIIKQMPLTMNWCLDCHKKNINRVRLTDCYTCHR